MMILKAKWITTGARAGDLECSRAVRSPFFFFRVELQITNHNVVTISGIGASSNCPGIHRDLRHAHPAWPGPAVATGMKLQRITNMTVLVTGGDGAAFREGGTLHHTMAAMGSR